MTGTETVQSLNVVNYAGMLYNKANIDTPFLNAISSKVYYVQSNEFITGEYYTSEEGDIPSISETASLTAPTASFVTRTQLKNCTMIFHESVAISYRKQSNTAMLAGLNLAGKSANPQNEKDFQIAQKMNKIKRSIEKTFIQGQYHVATADNDAAQTRGMNEAITTNVIDADGATLDIWLVNDLLAEIKAHQGDISNLVLWVNTANLNQINGNAVEYGMKLGEAYMSSFGIQVRDLLLPLGTIHIALGEFIPAGTAFAFNFNVIAPVEQPIPGKGNFFYEPLAKTGAGEKGQIYGQLGLDHGPEWYHGKITGLSTTFTKPAGQKIVMIQEETEEVTEETNNSQEVTG